MAITGAMLQFYKWVLDSINRSLVIGISSCRTTPAVVFWQFVNQSFNALVNYTNRNANSPVTTNQLGIAYVSATTSALIASLGYKAYLQKRNNPFLQRYAPFAAVAVANCKWNLILSLAFLTPVLILGVNIPLMRQNELKFGIEVEDEKGNIVGKSRLAAATGITQVVVSRIAMAAPGMILLPVLMERLERKNWFKRLSVLHAPFQVMMVGCFLVFPLTLFTRLIDWCKFNYDRFSWFQQLAAFSPKELHCQRRSSKSSNQNFISRSKRTPKAKFPRRFTSTKGCKVEQRLNRCNRVHLISNAVNVWTFT